MEKTALHAAAEKDDEKILWFLLEKAAESDNSEKQFGMGPLHKGSDAFGTDKMGRAVLHWAVQESHDEVVEVLLLKTKGGGALVHMVDFEQRTALHYAAVHGHLNITGILLQFGASVTPRDISDESPYDLAFKGGYCEVSKALAPSR
ncbi:ankyrin repeat-containing domain protein [Diaporthe sp. PMI_573]|nr:ankyrin repeat-containing domain protein [Diaporthaceae sp. PMI_573]